mmetsp:Transcript_2713/g.11042  ORF Transcript_2713/g.11042 Transcript_2713/m.11042 type:complete len:260 (-) Transcript_2713:592-1371(-)
MGFGGGFTGPVAAFLTSFPPPPPCDRRRGVHPFCFCGLGGTTNGFRVIGSRRPSATSTATSSATAAPRNAVSTPPSSFSSSGMGFRGRNRRSAGSYTRACLNVQKARLKLSSYPGGTWIFLSPWSTARTAATDRCLATSACAFLMPIPRMLGRKSQPESTHSSRNCSCFQPIKFSGPLAPPPALDLAAPAPVPPFLLPLAPPTTVMPSSSSSSSSTSHIAFAPFGSSGASGGGPAMTSSSRSSCASPNLSSLNRTKGHP